MKFFKKLLKWILIILIFPCLYFVFAFIAIAVTVNDDENSEPKTKNIYLNTNGVHLDVALHQKDMSPALSNSLIYFDNEKYVSFGWGDENFYINTPTWGELTFKNAATAMFWKSSTLMHLTRYETIEDDWVAVQVTDKQLVHLNQYILNSFKMINVTEKIYLPNDSYSINDNFYQANGSYSLFKTCNSWVNIGFKESGLKACYWTPFDFGLLSKYQK
jgi:uncharacterized protein (TIGR02117 family)